MERNAPLARLTGMSHICPSCGWAHAADTGDCESCGRTAGATRTLDATPVAAATDALFVALLLVGVLALLAAGSRLA